MDARTRIRNWAAEAGFDACAFTGAGETPGAAAALAAFLERGCHGGMAWMEARAAERAALDRLWSGARSAVVCGLNYGPADDPLAPLGRPGVGAISVYARNRDYHDLVKSRLKRVAREIAEKLGAEVKVFVDTAPVMEKPLAERAGLGWIGRHTGLVSRNFGCWLFLGVIATSLDLPSDPSHPDRCGRCRRCLAACPTGALTAPRRLDARLCLSYLSIEHPGPIPRGLRPAMGNRIYGCDDCLAACPWNRFAKVAAEVRLRERPDLAAPLLVELAALDDAGFRARFSGSPIKRIGRGRFLRNVMIALGNGEGDADARGAVVRALDDADVLVRGAAVWAAGRLLEGTAFAALAEGRRSRETDPGVAEEWRPGPAGAKPTEGIR